MKKMLAKAVALSLVLGGVGFVANNAQAATIGDGVKVHSATVGAYGYDAKQDMYFKYFIEEENQHFHGTGDIWASTLCGALLNGKTLQESIAIACDFVKDSIHKTLLEPDHNIYGVNFEQAIYGLLKRLYDEQ